jgi:hypothetical protein
MPVPSIIHVKLGLRKLEGLLALIFVTICALAKGPEPATRILLEPLGFQTLQTQFLLAGSSMLTVDFVDEKHLLVTYSTKRLLKRLSECPPSDQDRNIDAVLLELPEGKVLARTSWRLHDRGQYLWNLGQGRFMLRNRDTLTTLAPMVNLSKGDAFQERPFLTTKRRIGGVLFSPDADLMILETLEPYGRVADVQPTDEQKVRLETPVQINFFRLKVQSGDEIGVTEGAAFRTRVPGRIPANSAGYLATLDQGKQHWAFDFHTYGGKVKELSPFDSTCRPSPVLVSRSEFIAFGCGLNHAPQVLGGFNMRGEEMWQQNLMESYVAPTFAYAPKGGRFVMSRVLTHSGLVQAGDVLQPELVSGQSIVVYQTDSGRQVLHVDATPVVRAGQNYALAPDGMSLAVIRGDAIDIFSLPPLTPKEREAVKLAETSAPQDDGMPGLTPDDGSATESTNSRAVTPSDTKPDTPPQQPNEPAPASPAPANAAETPAQSNSAATPSQDPPAATATQEQPPPPEQPRKPPTLYNEPGEHPAASSTETQKPQPPKQ